MVISSYISNYTLKVLLLTILISALSATGVLSIVAYAETDGIGSGAMLRSGVDARALGMGGAFVAVADSYSAGHWNPAGINRSNSIYLGGMSLDKFGLGLRYNYISTGIPKIQIPFTENLSLTNNISGFIPRHAAFSLTLSDFSTEVLAMTAGGEPRGNITYSERLFKGLVGLDIPNIGSIGLAVKNYRFRAPDAGEDGEDATANGLGFDLGLLAEPIDNLWFGAAGFDLSRSLQLGGTIEATGTRIYWKNTPTEPTDVAPAHYSVGAAYFLDLDNLPGPEWFTGESIISGQYTFYEEDENGDPYGANKIRAGFEYSYSILSLRGGVVKPLESDFYFTLGAGLKVNLITIDAAWVQNTDVVAENTSDTIVISSEFNF